MGSLGPECTSKCRSLQHASDILSVVTRGSELQIKAFLSTFCWNATTLKDNLGRNVFHVVASCGKKGVLDWLVERKGADLHVKDKESGWTPLHRSIFYGHIDCALSLLKHGANLCVQDKEGLSALDLVMKDRPAHITFNSSDLTELYTWGNNINFTLGHCGHQSKHHPELVDLFPRTGLYIKQVVLCKFHSVFLTQKGQIYTCGHGQGGRLGHGDEQTYLVPKLVEGLISHPCTQAAAAKDHTVVLTEDGLVYTFGINTFHQLGIIPPTSNCNVPRQVIAKNLKGRTVIGIAAGRFHTVLWTKEAVYTMGLNGGQLGYLLDPNGEKCVTSPRQVSALYHKDISLSLVAASDGATVCVSERGDLYLLSDYQCKKLASKQLNLKKVLVSGGVLEHKSDPQHLKENGGQKVCILALDQAGRVFCWKSLSSSMKQCRWVYGRQVFMSDIALNRNGFMFVTHDGEGFMGKWSGDSKQITEKKDVIPTLQNSICDSFGNCDVNRAYERIRLEKLPYIHRAVSITTDPNGFNFAVLQSDPKTNLYEIPTVSPSTFSEDFATFFKEMDERDSIHDVTFQLDTRMFPVHKYILAMRSDFFRKLFLSNESSEQHSLDIYLKSEDTVGCDLFVMEKVNPEVFTYLLQFIYTDNCDLLTSGYKPKIMYKDKTSDHQDSLISDLQKVSFLDDIQGKSAYEVYRSNQIQADNERQRGKLKSTKKGKGIVEEANPVKMLQGVAKKFGISSLNSRLDGVRYENGKIKVVNKKSGNKPKLYQNKCSFLCDVTLQSQDGKEFQCHKCVLCARLEYFHSMLGSTWIEASCSAALQMPICSDVLQVILDYIYTDDAAFVKESENVEFICNVLVVADQLLIARLKEICEVAIAEKLTLKNAAEILEFSAMYNAEQLKLACLQFIGLNMGALLEARTLDVLSDDVLKELSLAYRKMIPAMERRIITPYHDGPDIGFLETEITENCIFLKEDDITENCSQEALLKKVKSRVKKKQRKRSDSSGGYTVSDIIQSPPSTDLDNSISVESISELQTSDSEGSYAGAASPRDLQSPDFLTALHPDHVEVKDKICFLGSQNAHYNVEMKLCDKRPASKPSIPISIPGNQIASANSPNWIASSLSPASPPALDLRAIMEIEENMLKHGTMPKTNAGGSKTVLHASKLSQKQRKMIALSAKENSRPVNTLLNTPATCTTSASTSATKTVRTWASSSSSSPTAFHSSFRNLLLEEQTSVIKSPPLPTITKNDFTEMEDPSAKKSLRYPLKNSSGIDEHHKSDLAQLDGSNPWLSTSAASPPVPTLVTFATIIEEEMEQEAALIRSRDKPLALIQIEECAIQDLLLYYRAFGNPDEFVIVERTSKGPVARPMWNKH
ncbi:inhibitor of Bruton tyrosine kinase [Ambystoma mexicanum]|uniref:inhibitor of Bruton tyrosine kinase n=1 Tax=Ambystoma mexicanum TaxID=8296 RepID=UPI0037E99003